MENEKKDKFLNSTAVMNILVMALTIAVIITCVSCLYSVERAKEKMADIESAISELKSSAPLDQFWTDSAMKKYVGTGSFDGDIKTVFITYKDYGTGYNEGEIIVISNDEDYLNIAMDNSGAGMTELSGVIEDYLKASNGELVILISRNRFSENDLAKLEEMISGHISSFAA